VNTHLAAAFFFVPVIAMAQSKDPQPQDATKAILAAFDKYDVVAMNAGHNDKKLDDFILSLVQNRELPGKVNDLVVECGNSGYQAILDRYIAGDSVSLEDARQAWRDTSVGMCALSSFYAELFPLVRRINQMLPRQKRFRVLLGEPPVDWTNLPTAPFGDRPGSLRLDRDGRIASVMMTEVLAKKHKALILCGVGHLYHGEQTAVSSYEQTYPGRTLVVQTHHGFAAFIDLDRGHQLEARMRSWPMPALVPIKGTWLADLDLPYFFWPYTKGSAGKAIANLADAYLYLGPGDSLTWETIPDSILDDQAYMAQLSKRFGMSAESLRKRNADTRLWTTVDRQEALRFAPGAQFVGRYATSAADKPLVEVDFHKGRLAVKLPMDPSWVVLTSADAPNRYRAEAPSQQVSLEFELSNGTVTGLVLDLGTGQPKSSLVYIP
jgi:hypothetical protein